jgi:hypothetical protein
MGSNSRSRGEANIPIAYLRRWIGVQITVTDYGQYCAQ